MQYKWEVYRGKGHSDTNGRRTAVQIGGVLQYFSDKLYALGVPKQAHSGPFCYYPTPQKHYIHKIIFGELIFGSLHQFHVIYCASRNYTWKVEASVSQSGFFADFYFEKSWSKSKHAFRPKDATVDAHMLSLSAWAWRRLCDVLSARESRDGMGYPPPWQGYWETADFSADFLRIFA